MIREKQYIKNEYFSRDLLILSDSTSKNYFNSAKNVSNLLWKGTSTEKNLPSTTAMMCVFRDFPNLSIVIIFNPIIELPNNSYIKNDIYWFYSINENF